MEAIIKELILKTDLKNLIENSLEDSKAEDIVIIDLDGKTDIADYMIVASGNSNRHVNSIAAKLQEELKINNSYVSVEGVPECNWVLIDTGDIIVHIFKPEVREYYNIEKMWSVPNEEE